MEKDFFDRLKSEREKIVNKWVSWALSTYPPKAQHFFKSQSDPFLNPVGNILKNELREIFDELLKDKASEKVAVSVDAIVRVRAVQDFSPSSAVMIFSSLKDVVRDVLKLDSGAYKWADVEEFYRRIDELCFLAFDVYVKCREKLWELKTKEFQAGIKNILRHYEVSVENNSGK